MARAVRDPDHADGMKHRHEQMIRAREQRKAQCAARLREVEAALRSSQTAEERRRWLAFSEAVAEIRLAAR